MATSTSFWPTDGLATDAEGVEPSGDDRPTTISTLAGRWLRKSDPASRNRAAEGHATRSLLAGIRADERLRQIPGSPHLVIRVSGTLVRWICGGGPRSLVIDDSVARINERGIASWTCRWHAGRLLIVTRLPEAALVLESVELSSSRILKHSVTLTVDDESSVSVEYFARDTRRSGVTAGH